MRIRVVDAFAERAFSGNPAAVCVLAAGEWPEADWMQAVAGELNLSETAFVRPSDQADADWDLRWFTPAIEVDMCGHATLATAHVLAGDGLVSGQVRFSTRSGILTAAVGDGITLDFPISRTAEIDVPAGLVDALGAKPESVHSTGALTDVLVVLPDEAAVRELAPDIAGLEVVNRRDHNRGTIVTAPAQDFDFVSRSSRPRPGSPRIRSAAVRTPRWRRTGPSASDGTNWSATRRPPEAGSCMSPQPATAFT